MHILGNLLFILSPLILMLSISVVKGYNVFCGVPIWSDEVDYWREMYSFANCGFNFGKNGFYLGYPLGALLAFFVQGTFFSKNLPIIDGHIIDWSDYSYMRIQSILIWLFSFVFSFGLLIFANHERFQTLSSIIGGFTLAFLLLSSALSGVFNNSVILIMADHGNARWIYNDDSGRQNPMLLVKGINEHAEFKTNNTPVSYENLLTAFDKLLKGKTAAEAFSVSGSEAQRMFYMAGDSIAAIGTTSIIEYVQTGQADDMSTLKETGVVYSFK